MTEAFRILLIDDESAIRQVLKMNLTAQGYQVKDAGSGAEGLKNAADFHPHLVILDLGLPDMSGREVLKEMRAWTTIPILVLTVNDDEASKVSLLDAGADDYLTKPFGVPELMARVRVALRHNGRQEATPVFMSEDLMVDVNQKVVQVKGERIKLTSTEFELLARLARERGKVVPQQTLLKEIWGAHAADQNHYLRIYINQLRKKLETNSAEPRHILTEPGVGYRLI